MHISIAILRLSEPAREWWQKRQIAGDIRRRAFNILRMPDDRAVWPRYRRATSPDTTSSITYTHNGNRQSNLILRASNEDYNLAPDNLVTLEIKTLNELNTLLSIKELSKWHIEYEPPMMSQQHGVSFDDFLDLSGSNRCTSS